MWVPARTLAFGKDRETFKTHMLIGEQQEQLTGDWRRATGDRIWKLLAKISIKYRRKKSISSLFFHSTFV